MNIKKRIQKAGCVLLGAVLLLLVFYPAASAADIPALETLITAAFDARAKHANAAGDLLSSPAFSADVSAPTTDWAAFAMARYSRSDGHGGRTYLYDADYEGFRGVMAKAVSGWKKDPPKSTDLQRAALCYASLGGDATDIGGFDLAGAASYNSRTAPKKLSVTGLSWALIVMYMYGEPMTGTYTPGALVEALLARRLPDGGWALNVAAGESDVDITAMALTALSPFRSDTTAYTVTNTYSKKEETLTPAGAIGDALALLSARQLENGDFSSYNQPCCESAAQVITALTALGIDPATDTRFIKNGYSVLDGLLRYRLSDGSFTHSFVSAPGAAEAGVYNYMATDQASYALVALWRYRNGYRGLFDLRADPEKQTQGTSQVFAAFIRRFREVFGRLFETFAALRTLLGK